MQASRTPIRWLALAGVACLWSASSVTLAQDAAVVNPDTVKVTLDNDQVRVIVATLPPGAKEKPHSHPAAVFYVLEGGKVRSHLGDGKVVETELVAGQTTYREPVTHWTENIGTTTVRLVLVELKQAR